MKMKNSITFKLISSILISSSIIFVVILSYNYHYSRKLIAEKIRENADDTVNLTINKIESILRGVEKLPENFAYLLEEAPFSNEKISEMLRSAVTKNNEVFGATVAFEPHAFDPQKKYFAPYYYKEGDKVVSTSLDGSEYNYFDQPWYRNAKDQAKPVWSEPYYDKGGGNIIMATYSVPFYKNVDGKRRCMGVVTADICLAWLQKIVSSVKIAESGYAVLISKKGKFVTYPHENMVMRKTIFDIAREMDNDALHEVGQKMVRGEEGFIPLIDPLTRKKNWLAYAPIPASGWALGVIFPQDELMASIYTLTKVNVGLAVIGCIVLGIIIILISGAITRPLRLLAKTTQDVSQGNLDFILPKITSRDEVGLLTSCFESMRVSLKEYIQNLKETTIAKERMEGELRVAHRIQMGFVPETFPEKKECDLFALLQSAREVGGDFYDYYFIDDDHLCFVIGDVSGKGVPAALFMAIGKILIKTLAQVTHDPGELIQRVNAELIKENDSSMFITLFFGVLDIRSGKVRYVNAGHNPPLLVRSGSASEYMNSTEGTIAGVFEEAKYTSSELVLGEGDVLLLYTDGVTEAINEKEEDYSEERLKDKVNKFHEMDSKKMADKILEDVTLFAGSAPQADDITLMALRYCGSSEGVKSDR